MQSGQASIADSTTKLIDDPSSDNELEESSVGPSNTLSSPGGPIGLDTERCYNEPMLLSLRKALTWSGVSCFSIESMQAVRRHVVPTQAARSRNEMEKRITGIG
jgi:hypothetical protein